MVLVGGVGDRTSNLFDASNLIYGYSLDVESGLPVMFAKRFATIQPISINCNSLVLKFDTDISGVKFIYSLFNDDTLITRESAKNSGETIDTTGANKIYISFYNSYSASLLPNDLKNIMLSENDNDYEPYGYKVPVMVEGKNLLRNTATSQTINGVTFTVNSDKSVTVNGTATDSARLMLGAVELSAGEQYTMTGCPSGGSNNTYRLDPRRTNGSVVVSFIDTSNGSTYIPEADIKLNIYIYIQSGNILDNLTFYPMIRKADIEDDTYEPYHEPTTTNIYLDEPIGANESISLSDTNVNIPTVRGTNILTVDTTVQPSNVYVKVRKESQYETIMRERYEEAQAQLDALESGGE